MIVFILTDCFYSYRVLAGTFYEQTNSLPCRTANSSFGLGCVLLKFLSHKECLHPKFWLIALAIVVFWALAHLPISMQLAYGRLLGRLLYTLSGKIRYVTRCNIKHCFPGLGADDLEKKVKESTLELGMSLAETFVAWFRRADDWLAEVRYEGLEHLERAIEDGRPVILVSCHHGSVDVLGNLITRNRLPWPEIIGTFKQTDAPVNSFLCQVRGKYSDRMLAVSDQRGVLRALKKKAVVWYAPDIEVRGNHTALVDFMGVPASTTTTISRLAKATGALVIPCGHDRVGEGFEYVCRFLPPLEGVPSLDPVTDTRAINASFEQLISNYPLRYWWAIKRFKRRPEGAAPIY